MAPRNPVGKPVIRQVSAPESPSVRPIEKATTSPDRADGSRTASVAETPHGDRERTGGRPRSPRGDLEKSITRGYVAWYLGVDVSTVRRLETRGQLHPQIGAGGIRYFEWTEIKRLRARRAQPLAERTADVRLAAFARFKLGHDWRDVAIQLQYDPYRIYRLWQLYTRDSGGRRP